MFYPYSGFKLGPDEVWSDQGGSGLVRLPLVPAPPKGGTILEPRVPTYMTAVESPDPVAIITPATPVDGGSSRSLIPLALGAVGLWLLSKKN